jgi:hypothetical protein
MSAPQCRGTWFRGCRWRARYDEYEPPTLGPYMEFSGDGSFLVHKTIYVRDVCERCGMVKERDQNQ